MVIKSVFLVLYGIILLVILVKGDKIMEIKSTSIRGKIIVWASNSYQLKNKLPKPYMVAKSLELENDDLNNRFSHGPRCEKCEGSEFINRISGSVGDISISGIAYGSGIISPIEFYKCVKCGNEQMTDGSYKRKLTDYNYKEKGICSLNDGTYYYITPISEFVVDKLSDDILVKSIFACYVMVLVLLFLYIIVKFFK